MATDIDLLKAAAKAAGIEAEWHYGCGDALHLTATDAPTIYWNPLRDDGQAFRLANALRLTVYHAELAVVVRHKQHSWECTWELMGESENENNMDRNALTRRAIVRAAAAMAVAR
jgi:hypothetical protein